MGKRAIEAMDAAIGELLIVEASIGKKHPDYKHLGNAISYLQKAKKDLR